GEVWWRDGRWGGRRAVVGYNAITALHPSTISLRVKDRGEMIAGKGEAVGRHPVIGEGERGVRGNAHGIRGHDVSGPHGVSSSFEFSRIFECTRGAVV